tara:strand:+ start:315 stop:578 length:264 start_codon:yes stop_codon:yes gene_type:complete
MKKGTTPCPWMIENERKRLLRETECFSGFGYHTSPNNRHTEPREQPTIFVIADPPKPSSLSSLLRSTSNECLLPMYLPCTFAFATTD